MIHFSAVFKDSKATRVCKLCSRVREVCAWRVCARVCVCACVCGLAMQIIYPLLDLRDANLLV